VIAATGAGDLNVPQIDGIGRIIRQLIPGEFMSTNSTASARSLSGRTMSENIFSIFCIDEVLVRAMNTRNNSKRKLRTMVDCEVANEETKQ
jgi:hypothetical protein